MSFLLALQEKKLRLCHTATRITTADGKQFIEDSAHAQSTPISSDCEHSPSLRIGFVIDTKPDKVPSKILECLYLGSQDAVDFDILREFDISYILSVGIPLPLHVDESEVKFSTMYLNCLDLPETNLKNVLNDAIAFIDEALAKKANILIHCNAGVSRSPAIVIGYLILRRGMSYAEAYAWVKQLRAAIRPNDGFVRQLQCLIG